MKSSLSHSHQKTYDAVLAHPAPHNLHWRDVKSMLGELGELTEEANGHLKVTLNGESLMLHPDNEKDIGSHEQLKAIRGFLKRASGESAAKSNGGADVLVVIDHREARVYKSQASGTTPERIAPQTTSGSGGHLHSAHDDSNATRVPGSKGFFDAIAKSLHGAESILVFGGGTGTSSAREQLMVELKQHHKDIATRIVGSVSVDEHHQSEDELLAKAREYYAKLGKTATAAS